MDAQDPKASDDREYLARCLNGQTEAYRVLVERYQAPLVAWLSGRLRDSTAAEEIAQETFVRAWFALARFRIGDAFFPWLAGIAQKVTRERSRAQARQERHQRAAGLDRQGITEDAGPTDERDLSLRSAVDALPQQLREIVLLRYYGGCACKEVARRLGLPLGTVTKNLSRAHARLRELLSRDAEGSIHPDSRMRR